MTNSRSNPVYDFEDDDPTVELEILPGQMSALLEAERIAKLEACMQDIEPANQSFEDEQATQASPAADESIVSLKAELDSRDAKIDSLQAELEQQLALSAELKKQVESGEVAVTDVRGELESARSRYEDSSEQLEKRDAEIAHLRDQLEKQAGLLDESTQALAAQKELKLELRQRSDQVEKLKMRLEKQAAFIGSLTEQFSRKDDVAPAKPDCAENTKSKSKAKKPDAAKVDPATENAQPVGASTGTQRAGKGAADEHKLRALISRVGKTSQTFPLLTDDVSVGCGADNDIQLSDQFISHHHATIVSSSSGSVIRDLDSANGTYVNGRRVRRHALRDGDSIEIGKSSFEFLEKGVEVSFISVEGEADEDDA